MRLLHTAPMRYLLLFNWLLAGNLSNHTRRSADHPFGKSREQLAAGVWYWLTV